MVVRPASEGLGGRVGQFFEKQGCRMVEMSCEEHDRIAAGTQFVTHTVGRLLGHLDLRPTQIDTRGFESLLNLVNNTKNDSFELYYGLFMYNQVPAPPTAGPCSTLIMAADCERRSSGENRSSATVPGGVPRHL